MLIIHKTSKKGPSPDGEGVYDLPTLKRDFNLGEPLYQDSLDVEAIYKLTQQPHEAVVSAKINVEEVAEFAKEEKGKDMKVEVRDNELRFVVGPPRRLWWYEAHTDASKYKNFDILYNTDYFRYALSFLKGEVEIKIYCDKIKEERDWYYCYWALMHLHHEDAESTVDVFLMNKTW